MTDDRKGECKSCGDNAAGKPVAKSAAEIARESWLQDLVIRPYQPKVEALSAARRGAAAVAAMESPGAAHPAPQEFPAEPRHPAPGRQPRAEVSHLPAPWEQPAYQPTSVIAVPPDVYPQPRLPRPQELPGAIKVDPRAKGETEYLTWWPGGTGAPWVEIQAAKSRSRRVGYSGVDIPLRGLFAEPETVSYVLQEENDDCVWTVIIRKHKDGSSPRMLEASRIASEVIDAAQAGTLVLPTLFVVKRDDGTEQYFEYDGATGECTFYVSYLGDRDRERLGSATPRPRVVIEIDVPLAEAEPAAPEVEAPPPEAPAGLPDPGKSPPSGEDRPGLGLGKNTRWHAPTVSGRNPPSAEKAEEYGDLPTAPECGPVYSVKRTLTLAVELDRRELLRKNVRGAAKPDMNEAKRLFADEVASLSKNLAAAEKGISPENLPPLFAEGVRTAIANITNPRLCPAVCPLVQVISVDGWTVLQVGPLEMGGLQVNVQPHGPKDDPVGWVLTGYVSLIGDVTVTLWFKYSCSQS